ncbi:MAG: hypothetical protein HQL80_05595 [Magnetococcales bacterium]|nr:hypothetical protein [Magnetococcales bacterium]
MVIISPKSRSLQRVGILLSAVLPLVYATDAAPPGCLLLIFSDTPFCLETDPVLFWLYLLLLLAILSYGIVAVIGSWHTIEPELLDHEADLLRKWSGKGRHKSGEQLLFPPRSLLAAWIVVALWFAPFLYLAIVHQSLYPSDFQLEFTAVLLFGTLFVWLLVRWLSESLLLTSDGVQYRNLLRRGGIRRWSAFRHLELIDDGNRGSQGIRLYARRFGSDIVVNRNTLPRKDDFVTACRFIVAAMLEQRMPIHLSLSGVEAWTNACHN